jgi:hypothetical protein
LKDIDKKADLEFDKKIAAEKIRIPKGPISIDIDPANRRVKSESEGSDLVVDVEDVVDIDIYNRFEKYYLEKIKTVDSEISSGVRKPSSFSLNLDRSIGGY